MGDQVGKISQDAAKRRAADALNEVESGPGKSLLGTALFDQVARHSISCAFEAVALRRRADGQLEIYLRQRAADDTAYPNQWHCPGSVRRPYEKWDHVAARLSRGEFKADIVDIRKVGEIPTNEARGSFISFVFLVGLVGDTDPTKWFPVDDLPQVTVDIHVQMIIPLAVAAFELEEAEDVLEEKRGWLAELRARFCDE